MGDGGCGTGLALHLLVAAAAPRRRSTTSTSGPSYTDAEMRAASSSEAGSRYDAPRDLAARGRAADPRRAR